MTTLIPRRLRELREELFAQLTDNEIERKQVASITAKGKLSSEERSMRSTIQARLAHGLERVKELEAEIDGEVEKHGNAKALEARAASRKAVSDSHVRTKQRHLDRAAALEQWRQLSVSMIAEHRQAFAQESRVMETAVKHLSDSDLGAFTRHLEGPIAFVRGWDHVFAQALANAIEDIMFAARDGVIPTSGKRPSFAEAAKRAVDTLDGHLPAIHSVKPLMLPNEYGIPTIVRLPNESGELLVVPADEDLGTNPELVEEPAAYDKWSEAIKQGNEEEVTRQAEMRAYNANTAGGKTDEYVDLIRNGIRPRTK